MLLFEIANVYFIMPMPRIQRVNSIDTANFLYKWRWVFRGLFGLMIIIGLLKAKWHKRKKWALIVPLGILPGVVYLANFNMAVDAMFQQPKQFPCFMI